jgi:hypothetical protein
VVSLCHNHALLEDPWVILAAWLCEEPLPFEDLLREEPPCELPGKEACAVAGCACGQGITMTFEFLQYPQTLERVNQFESTRMRTTIIPSHISSTRHALHYQTQLAVEPSALAIF